MKTADKMKPGKNAAPQIQQAEKRWHFWAAIAALIIVPFILYWPSMRAPFILDDIPKIVENQNIKSLQGISQKLIFSYKNREHTFSANDPSRPLVYFTFALNHYFNGLDPFGYRLFNLLVHIMNSILVLILARRIQSFFSVSGFFFPIMASLIFACHPANTNVVSYVFSRSDALATFFYLGSILLFFQGTRGNRLYLVTSILCFIGSLFSKQNSVTLPIIILMSDYLFISGLNFVNLKTRFTYHTFYWLTLFTYLIYRVVYLGGIGDLEAKETIERLPYILSQPYAVVTYLYKIFVPIRMAYDHAVAPLSSVLDVKFILPFTVMLVTASWVVYRTLRSKTQFLTILCFGVLWFVITLSPTSSFFPTTSVYVENRIYLAGVGIIIALSWASVSWIQSYGFKGAAALYLVVLCVLTFQRNKIYSNPILLEKEVLSIYPNHPRANNALGVLIKNQDPLQAEELFLNAIKNKSDYAEAYSNLALLHYKKKDLPKALEYYDKAIQINPRLTSALFNRGNIYLDLRDYPNAQQLYQKAIASNPQHIQSYTNIALVYQSQKKYGEAEQYLEKALAIDPKNTDALINLGTLYAINHHYESAREFFEKALILNPEDRYARLNLDRLEILEQKQKRKMDR